jgi:hypothetical protein
MSTISVKYKELGAEFGLEEGDGPRGPFAVKPYWVDWKDRYTFSNDVLGKAAASGGIGSGWVRTTPYPYPGSPNMFARECSIKPEGTLITDPVNGRISYSDAIVMVTFGIPEATLDPSQDPFFLNSLSQDPIENQSLLWATQELDFATEWISVPNSSVKFFSDYAKKNTPIAKPITKVSMSITWHNYPVLPMYILRQFADSVNDKVFLGCDKGTVKFDGAKTIREYSRDGGITQKVQAGFTWRSYDWNRFLRDDGYSWDLVIDTNSDRTNPVYTFTYRDFGALLRYFA